MNSINTLAAPSNQTYLEEIDKIYSLQRKFFNSGNTLDITFRKQQLLKLKEAILKWENKLNEAIYKDLKKSKYDTYITEIGLLINEIDLFVKKLNKWSRKKRVWTNLSNLPGTSYILREPYGNALIIGAWNYPYLLTLNPLICSMAAGNVNIVKPSGTAPNTSKVMAEMLNATFDRQYLHVIEGRGSMVERVMENHFDKIFFTGSQSVGRELMKKAADTLSSISLELGGKSPCLITNDAMNDVAFQRLSWGKFFNAGQTCVAPDYVLVPKKSQDEFLKRIKEATIKLIGEDHKKSEFYCKIISKRHLERFEQILPKDKIFFGGEFDYENRFLSPTILRDITLDDEIMKHEIFGPIMPVLTYESIDEAIAMIKSFPKPLSFHYYTNNNKLKKKLLREISSGSGGINDSLVFMSNHNLPFGGVGNSGMGKYHGKFGFNEFTNPKGVLDRPLWFELPFKYPPITNFKDWISRKFS